MAFRLDLFSARVLGSPNLNNSTADSACGYTTTLTGKNPTATLTASFYVYVTNAKPDSNFTKNGGKVHIVVVYDGSISSKDAFAYDFGLTDNSELLSFKRQSPISGSETTKGNYNIYTVNFDETMSMYCNSGNDSINFAAEYKEDFSLLGYKQYAGQQTHTWGWVLCATKKKETRGAPSLNGLQVFEASKLGTAKITLFQDGAFPKHCFELNHDLDFSAATMIKAKLGG